MSLPIGDLRARLPDIDSGASIVAYCRGSYCVYADEAVRLLAEAGREAAPLEDGFLEWAAARLPVHGVRPGLIKKTLDKQARLGLHLVQEKS